MTILSFIGHHLFSPYGILANSLHESNLKQLEITNRRLDAYSHKILQPNYFEKNKEDRLLEKKTFWTDIHIKKELEQTAFSKS